MNPETSGFVCVGFFFDANMWLKILSENFKIVRFELTSTDMRVYLSGRREDGRSFLIKMSQSLPGVWFADVPLGEGKYHTRYYCGNEHSMTYFGPAHLDGSGQDGLDAVVVVA